jgi:peroxiredoxin
MIRARAAFPRWARTAVDVGFWVALGAILVWRAWPQVSGAIGIARGDLPVPDVVFETIDGERFTSADLRGQVVLVNFWATWCGPCRVEMPGFDDVYRSRRERGFTIVGVSQDVGTPDLVRRFVAERGVSYPIVAGTPELERAFGGVSVLPTSFLVGRDGRIRHVVRGIWLEATLAAAVDRLLDEPSAISHSAFPRR